MRDCPKCGSYVPEGKFACPACGRIAVGISNDVSRGVKSDRQRTGSAKRNTVPGLGDTYENQNHSADMPVMTKRIFCAAAYFGFFFFLPLIALPNSEEAKFHANQGLVLFLFGLLLNGIAAATSTVLGSVFEVLVVLHPLLMVYGASNAIKGNMTELPLIGKFKILKGYDRF